MRARFALVLALVLGGCGTTVVPVVAVPNPAKPLDQVQREEATCRERGSAAAHGQWAAFFAAYSACQRGYGNQVQPVPWVFAYGVYYGHVLPGPEPMPFGAPYYSVY